MLIILFISLVITIVSTIYCWKLDYLNCIRVLLFGIPFISFLSYINYKYCQPMFYDESILDNTPKSFKDISQTELDKIDKNLKLLI